MVGYCERGDLKYLHLKSLQSHRLDTDRGTFTVQESGPILAKRKKKGTKSRKNVRLTPIHENDEREREMSFSSSEVAISGSPDSAEYIEGTPERTTHRDVVYERSDTPVRKSSNSNLTLDFDTFEEELENIPEESHFTVQSDPRDINALADLPPRPKCKLKVLPPSITGSEQAKPKAKLLKLRHKIHNRSPVDNSVYRHELAVAKELQRVVTNETIRMITEKMRPKSADRVRVIRLGDLSSTNSSSVPDLPSIIKKIAKQAELRDEEIDANRPRAPVRESSFDDSGALSTPRDGAKTQNSLRGTDISSFYHMWERTSKKRPFDRKVVDKGPKIQTHRSCMCSIRNCVRKCSFQKNNVLPPIVSPHRDS